MKRRKLAIPSFPTVLKEKKKCRPKREEVHLSDSNVHASTQVMLDLSMRRLLLNPEVAAKIRELQKHYGNVKMEFIYKLGMQA